MPKVFCDGCRQGFEEDVAKNKLKPLRNDIEKIVYEELGPVYELDIKQAFELFNKKIFAKKLNELFTDWKYIRSNRNSNRLHSFEVFIRKDLIINWKLFTTGKESSDLFGHKFDPEEQLIQDLNFDELDLYYFTLNYCQNSNCHNNSSKSFCLKCLKSYCYKHFKKGHKNCIDCEKGIKQPKKKIVKQTIKMLN